MEHHEHEEEIMEPESSHHTFFEFLKKSKRVAQVIPNSVGSAVSRWVEPYAFRYFITEPHIELMVIQIGWSIYEGDRAGHVYSRIVLNPDTRLLINNLYSHPITFVNNEGEKFEV